MSLVARLRHSYGFGVHSPAAYALVKDVVNPGGRYGYYAYRQIESVWGRLLLRLLVHASARSVTLHEGCSSEIRHIVKCAGADVASGVEVTQKRSDVFIAAAMPGKRWIQRWLECEVPYLIVMDIGKRGCERLSDSLCESMAGGVILESRDFVIARQCPTDALHRYALL